MASSRHPLEWMLIVVPVFGIFGWTAARPFLTSEIAARVTETADPQITQSVAALDDWFEQHWEQNGVSRADHADQRLVFRRLSLALNGTVPSLGEIRGFDADAGDDRVARWTERRIQDSRFVDYVGGRLTDGLINPLAEDVKPFHRFGFRDWLGENIQRGTPWDQLVREMVAGRGRWGDHAGTTFAFAELSEGEQAAERLAARTVRTFLGQRIDCAQCHDHPFDHWKQADFEGLAAFYAPARLTNYGVQDPRRGPLVIEDMRASQQREVNPRVPFDDQWLSQDRHSRDQLAAWLTHSDNRRFRRAIANRVWGLMFGRPLVEPVDDIPDPVSDGSDSATDPTRPLDILGDALAASNYDLRHIIYVIAASRVFQLQSSHPLLENPETAAAAESSWAVFPLTHLTPEQYIRSLQQASTLTTLNLEHAGTVATLQRYAAVQRFVQNSEMSGDEEAIVSGTVPQTVERLMGNHTRQLSRSSPLTGPGRISLLANDVPTILETSYLTCLTRLPTDPEREYFTRQLSESSSRGRSRLVEDLYWSLFNSAEFCWNH